MNGLTAVNYGDVPVLAGCNECESDTNYKQGGYTYRFANLSFVNSAKRTTWVSPYKDIFQDVDGSLAGSVNGTVLHYWGWNDWPNCPRDTVGTYDYGTVCDGSVQVRRLVIDAVQPGNLYGLNILISSDAGSGSLPWRPKEEYGWVAPVVNTHNYVMRWDSQTDWYQMDIKYSNPAYLDSSSDEWTSLTWPYIDKRYGEQVSYYGSYPYELIPSKALANETVSPSDAFGTGTLPNLVPQGNWTVMLSMVVSGGRGRERERERQMCLTRRRHSASNAEHEPRRG